MGIDSSPRNSEDALMNISTEARDRFFGRLFNYANNPLTITGTVMTTLSGLLIIMFLLYFWLHPRWKKQPPGFAGYYDGLKV